MATNTVDKLGQWTTAQTFAPEGAEVGPDGEIISKSWEGEQYPAVDTLGLPLPDDSQGHGPNGFSNGAAHPMPGDDQFDYIEPIQPGEDPELPLNSRDVFAFIVNKMIGTGIFIQPPAVLLFTRSKAEALGLWVVGFAYTIVSMLLYIEFSRKIPHTGGELVYVRLSTIFISRD